MNLLNTRLMLGIASIALGISLMMSTYVFATNSNSKSSEKELVIADSVATEQDVVLLVEKSPFMNKCMVTNIDQFAPMYDTPADTGVLLGKMYIGACGDVLEKGDTWTKVSSGSVVGYVNNSYLVFDAAAEALANQTCKWIATVNADALNVRSAPDQTSGVLGLVYCGETYDVLSSEGDWISIQYEGQSGYIAASYLSVVQQITTAVSVEEEAAAIAAEQARQAAIAAEQARIAAENEAKIQAQVARCDFASTLASSPYAISERDAYLMACLVDCEAGYESYDGKLAVANILLNRLSGGYYGNTIESVVYARNQFSVVGVTLSNKLINGPRTDETIQAVKDALLGNNNVPDYANFISYKIANTDSYSAWIQIGAHIFYRR